eukprot:scaffold110439_cov32-Tisochrysis_lutea.AAC.3
MTRIKGWSANVNEAPSTQRRRSARLASLCERRGVGASSPVQIDVTEVRRGGVRVGARRRQLASTAATIPSCSLCGEARESGDFERRRHSDGCKAGALRCAGDMERRRRMRASDDRRRECATSR